MPYRECRKTTPYNDDSESEEDNFQDVDSSFNQTLEDNTVEGQKQEFKSKKLTSDLAKDLEKCKLDGSTIVYVDSDEPEEVEVGHVVGGPEGCKVQADNMPDPPPVVDFDVEDGLDGEKAQDHARSIKVEFNSADIRFWFAQVEDEMAMATIRSQWLKRSVLARNLPTKQKEDVKAYLMLPKTQAGAQIYLNIKKKLVKIYAPTPSDSYCKALTRTMVGLPSQLGYQIVDDICKKPDKLNGCCCAGAAQALWSLQLPINIRAHVSNLEFSKDTYKEVFEAADKVYLSSKQLSVAAVAGSLDETLSAFNPHNQPQVAAVGRGGGKGNKGNKKGENNSSNPSSGSGDGGDKPKNKNRGKKHSTVPEAQASKMCDRHYRHGANAWFCLKPLTCPWVSKVQERP